MKSKARIIKSPDKAKRQLAKIEKTMTKGGDRVLIGLPKSSNAYPDGTSVIQVGIIHEFGSPDKNIPARTYLRNTISEKSKEYRKMIAKLTKQIIKGRITKEQALGLLGLQAQGDVQKKITDIDKPPLKIRVGGNPLVDTGHLRQSITFKVDK